MFGADVLLIFTTHHGISIMIKNLLAIIGLAVVIRQAYQHYVKFGKLQNENVYLHRRRQEEIREKDL